MAPAKRFITPQQARVEIGNGRRIGPGFWVDAGGALHVSVPELLEVFGWPDDETHRTMVIQTIYEVARQQWPEVEWVETVVES